MIWCAAMWKCLLSNYSTPPPQQQPPRCHTPFNPRLILCVFFLLAVMPPWSSEWSSWWSLKASSPFLGGNITCWMDKKRPYHVTRSWNRSGDTWLPVSSVNTPLQRGNIWPPASIFPHCAISSHTFCWCTVSFIRTWGLALNVVFGRKSNSNVNKLTSVYYY